MLTLLEIIIVAAFIASLAAIAALGSLGARKRNRAAEIPKALRLVDSAMDCDAG